jgi:hemerythrin-like domain-containing protein
MDTSTGPIKRHEAIVQFSREHHFGLLLIWKIRQGLKKGIELKRIADYVLFFFDEDLKDHFAEEERLLFTKLEDTDVLKLQALKEHEEINNLIDGLRKNDADTEQLNIFADTLERHIRFEERVLFNHLQSKLSDEELWTLAKEHPEREVNTDAKWSDHFWL